MWIRTRLASVGMSLEARNPTKDHPDTMRENLSFGLLPGDGRDHLDLDTGEVFQDYNYARLHKNEKKLIGASISIRPLLDDSYYKDNVMSYISKYNSDVTSHPSQIHFMAFIDPTAFRELADNIKRGLFPETITIGFEDRTQYFTIVDQDGTRQKQPKQALEFGWEPDGSGMIWHNTEQENRKVPITSVRFEYAVFKALYDEKQTHRMLPMRVDAPAYGMIEQTARIQTSLAKMSKYLERIAAILVGLAVAVAVAFYFK
jgi:hypothetical protein